jgi:hypothetical protein
MPTSGELTLGYIDVYEGSTYIARYEGKAVNGSVIVILVEEF